VGWRETFQKLCRERVLDQHGLTLTRGPGAEVWSEKETLERYGRAMGDLARIADMKTTEGTTNGRKRTFKEFQEFLQRNPFGVTVETATPEDVGAFLLTNWMPRHSQSCRTVVPSTGAKVASASAVKGVVKNLSKSYTLLGFEGRQNPAKAEVIKSFRDGCERMLHQEGVRVQRAKVFPVAKLDALLAHLRERIESLPVGLERCTAVMDQAAVLYLWESLARGKEAGKLVQDQVNHEDGAAYPGWSKTVRQEPSARIPLKEPSEEGRLSFVEASVELAKELERFGDPLKESSYLIRAQNRSKTGFSDGPISSSALRKRIQRRLQDANLFAGETVHSFRRSAVQHAAINLKYDSKKLMELGRWKSYAAFKVYVEEVWKQ
jgi:integrase